MNQRDNAFYRSEVDVVLKKLRLHCLGLDRRLTDILPEPYRSLPLERKASHLARQLFFQVVKQDPYAEREDLKRTWQWLYVVILHLLTECNEADQTFGNLVRLIGLDYFTRLVFFEHSGPLAADIRDNLFAPPLLEDLELAVISLLDSRRLLTEGKRVSRQLKELAG